MKQSFIAPSFEKDVKSPEELGAFIEHLGKLIGYASFRKERCELLMKRGSSQRWNVTKKARMLRRHIAVMNEIDALGEAVHQTQVELDRLVVAP